jgi:hypothetical protein
VGRFNIFGRIFNTDPIVDDPVAFLALGQWPDGTLRYVGDKAPQRIAITVVFVASEVDDAVRVDAAIRSVRGVLGTSVPRRVTVEESEAIIHPALLPPDA